MTRREQPAAVTVEPLGKEKTGDTKKKFPKENPNKPSEEEWESKILIDCEACVLSTCRQCLNRAGGFERCFVQYI